MEEEYYVLDKAGVRITDEFGTPYIPMSKDEAEEYIYDRPGLSMLEVPRFNKYQGY